MSYDEMKNANSAWMWDVLWVQFPTLTVYRSCEYV